MSVALTDLSVFTVVGGEKVMSVEFQSLFVVARFLGLPA